MGTAERTDRARARRRLAALVVGLLGLASLLSIPPRVLEHLRERARLPPRDVVNGEVVEVVPSEQGFTATVELRPHPSLPPVRFDAPSESLGYLFPRSSLEVGDRVLVDFDPAEPENARVFSIRPLWSFLVRRSLAGVVLVVAAVAMFLSTFRAKVRPLLRSSIESNLAAPRVPPREASGGTNDMTTNLDQAIERLAKSYRPLAESILREAIRIPADHVDAPVESGGDPRCGLSNHEGPRLEYLKRVILEHGAVDGPDDVGFDEFGNLWWQVEDRDDGVPAAAKRVIWYDGHTDTVQALRPRWREASAGGLDPYFGLVDASRLDRAQLRRELGYLPSDGEWEHLLWGRGSADQLGGVVCEIVAAKILRELRPQGALAGVIVRFYGTVAEEDNDGGGPMWVMRHELPGAPAERIPDVVILTEGTGCSSGGALGIYRGQRGRMQIEVVVTGKSCHGSMPHEGRNPLEYGGAILAEAAEAYRRGDGFLSDPFLGAGSRTASDARLETPSDCAVPERFTFRFDRRLTAGEDPEQARSDIERLASVARARAAGLTVEVRIPTYDQPSWRGVVPGNPQIYPGWVTPETHPAIVAAVRTYQGVVTPQVTGEEHGGSMRRAPRVSRWVFSTDGVGVPVPRQGSGIKVPESKRWIAAGVFHHPAMFGIGPGIEHNTHKIGECVDTRELAPVVAFYARFPSCYREIGEAS